MFLEYREFRCNKHKCYSCKQVTNGFLKWHIILKYQTSFFYCFKTVKFYIILRKLDYHGFRGVTNQWIKNYLTNRYQYIKLEDVESPCKEIQFGVPQGSVLGPLLFYCT